MNKKIIIGLFIGIVGMVLGIKLDRWRSPFYPHLKLSSGQDFHDKVLRDPGCQYVNIKSMGSCFDIHFIKNVDENNPNPYFPAICITTSDTHAAWLQIVRTDSLDHPEYRCFIDAWPKGHEKYPFYTQGQNFYDNPMWTYGLFSRDISFWIGHAYAVNVDYNQKTMECIGGISWGYKLPWYQLRPSMILPQALTAQSWQTDWKILELELPGYRNVDQK